MDSAPNREDTGNARMDSAPNREDTGNARMHSAPSRENTGNARENVSETPSPRINPQSVSSSSRHLSTSHHLSTRRHKRSRTQRHRRARNSPKSSSSNSSDSKRSTRPSRSKKLRGSPSWYDFRGFAFDHTRYPEVELSSIDLRDFPCTSDGRYVVNVPIVKLVRINPNGLSHNTPGLYRVRYRNNPIPLKKKKPIPVLKIKDEPEKEELKKEEPKIEEPKKEEPKKEQPKKEQPAAKVDKLNKETRSKKALFTCQKVTLKRWWTPQIDSDNSLEVIQQTQPVVAEKETMTTPTRRTKHLDKRTMDEMIKLVSPDSPKRSSSAFAKFKNSSKQPSDKKGTPAKSKSLFDLSNASAETRTKEGTKTSLETEKRPECDSKSTMRNDDSFIVDTEANVSTDWPASDESVVERTVICASTVPFDHKSSTDDDPQHYDSSDLCFSPISPIQADRDHGQGTPSKSAPVSPLRSDRVIAESTPRKDVSERSRRRLYQEDQSTPTKADCGREALRTVSERSRRRLYQEAQSTPTKADFGREARQTSPETIEKVEKFMSETLSISTPKYYVQKEVIIQNFTLVLDQHLEDIEKGVKTPMHFSNKPGEFDIEMLARFTPVRVVTKQEAFLPIKVNLDDIEPCEKCECSYFGRNLKKRFIVDVLLEMNFESNPRLPERKLFDLARALANL